MPPAEYFNLLLAEATLTFICQPDKQHTVGITLNSTIASLSISDIERNVETYKRIAANIPSL